MQYFGKDGPIRIKQALYLSFYTLILLVLWIMNADIKSSIILSLVYIANLCTFAWIGYCSYDTKSLKLNVMMDLKTPNHLITSILRRIEKREFEQLAYEAYEAELHCYESLTVKTPSMYYCNESDSCIDGHHKYSYFFGKAIGRDNAIAYFWFLMANTILNFLIAANFINCINIAAAGSLIEEEGYEGQEASSSLLRFIACFIYIFSDNRLFTGALLLLTLKLLLSNLDKLL